METETGHCSAAAQFEDGSFQQAPPVRGIRAVRGGILYHDISNNSIIIYCTHTENKLLLIKQ